MLNSVIVDIIFLYSQTANTHLFAPVVWRPLSDQRVTYTNLQQGPAEVDCYLLLRYNNILKIIQQNDIN